MPLSLDPRRPREPAGNIPDLTATVSASTAKRTPRIDPKSCGMQSEVRAGLRDGIFTASILHLPGPRQCPGDPCPLRPAGQRHALPNRRPSHQRTRPSRRPSRENHQAAGRTHGMHARLSGPRQAGISRQRGPSVAVRGNPTVTPTVLAAWTPSAICPWIPQHAALQRYKVTHGGTKQTARIAALTQLAGRFRR